MIEKNQKKYNYKPLTKKEYNKIIKKNGSFFQDIIITLKASNIKLIRVRYSNN